MLMWQEAKRTMRPVLAGSGPSAAVPCCRCFPARRAAPTPVLYALPLVLPRPALSARGRPAQRGSAAGHRGRTPTL
jgi:hypothetical protein